ncbi:MAG TPA: PQQ-binding-like beta-propeller repeat protein [Actinomycetota bacterium]
MPPGAAIRRHLLLLPIAASLLALGPAAAAQRADASWPTAGGDAAHTGVASGPEPPYRVAWEVETDDDDPICAPVVAEGLVIVVMRESVMALSAGDGSEAWSVDREEGPAGAAVVLGETVAYVEGRDDGASLVAAGLTDGAELWSFDLDDSAPGPLAADADTVFVATSEGLVHALDAETGEEDWSFEVEGETLGAPAVAGGLVYVSAARPSARAGTVYAIDAETGEEAWRFSPSGSALGFSSFAVAGDLAYVGTGDRTVRALGVEDGREVWSRVVRAPFGPRSMPAVPGDLVVGDVLGGVYRLGAADGEIAWDFRVPGSLLSGSPIVAGGFVVVGDDTGQASAIDLEEGLLVWKDTFGSARLEAPAADGDHVYLASRGGRVVALEHDPDAALLAEPSPTTLFPLQALLNFAAAAAALLVLLLVVFRVVLPAPREEAES